MVIALLLVCVRTTEEKGDFIVATLQDFFLWAYGGNVRENICTLPSHYKR